MRRSSSFAAALALIVAFASVANAQPPASSPDAAARADQLFKEGTAALEQRRFDVACPKLAESRRVDPQGLGTLVNLARCNEEWGKTATAYAQYGELEARASERNQPERVAIAQKHRAALEGKLSRVTVKITSPTQGERIKLDDRLVTEDLWGTALPMDPGTHTIEATVTGHPPWSKAVTVPPGPSSTDLTVPDLVGAPTEGAAATPAPAEPSAHVVAKPGEPARDGSGQRIVGFVVGGVGLVALGVGAVFGVKAISGANDVKNACPTADTCKAGALDTARSDYDGAKTAATLSTVLVPVGAVALAAGAVLILTAPKGGVYVTPEVGKGSAGIGMRGTF